MSSYSGKSCQLYRRSSQRFYVLALLFGGHNGHNRHVGCIDPSCDVIGVIKDAYENARFLCDQYYMASPELIIKQHNGKFELC